MKEDSAVLYEELLKGLDKVKAKAENEAANGSIESPILKSSNSHIKKRKERKSQFENNNVEDKENLEKTSSEVSINEDIEELYDERDEIANLANKKSLKKPLINNKDINLLKENNDIVNYNSQRAVIKNKDDKNFWEKLYICGASFIFIISCFLISLFVLTFSFLFYLHMMKIAADPIRLGAFLNDIWMAFSGGAFLLFIYLLGYFVKNNYKSRSDRH